MTKYLSRKKITCLYSFIAPVILISGLFGLTAALPGCKPGVTEKVELEFWGVFDDSDVFDSLISDFNKVYPYITVNYYKKNSQTYEKDLLEAMASGRGPDIFMLHHTWLPRYQDKIWAAPSDLISLKDLQNNFVDVVSDDCLSEGSVTALPLSVDTLALFYNKDIFNSAGIAQPPRTWEEFLSDVEKLTQRDERGNIVRAGAAIGTSRNINRSTDILSLLMLQSGTPIVDKQDQEAVFDQSVSVNGETFYPGERALEFYTDFANSLKSVYAWNTRLHYSLDAFYEGQTAMIFNYAYNLPVIQAKSPYLNFNVAAMPQPANAKNIINYANYWALAVSHNSENSEAAWQFIVWLTNKENSQKYLEEVKKPTARRDLIDWQKSDPDLGIFAEQALTAYSWYQVDNSAIETSLADMIESVVLGEATVEQAIDKAVSQINLLMK